MTIQELRIGNIIRHNVKDETESLTGFCEPNEDAISEDDMWHFTGGVGFEDAEPIPLTREWLEKFGLFKYNNAWVFEMPEERQYLGGFSIFDYGNRLAYNTSDIINPPLEFVHQLQNLYFALTGEELTLKK